jgi:hypothetical protein
MSDTRQDTSINVNGLVMLTRGNVWRGINSLSGASQLLMAASPSRRKRLIFKNGPAIAALNLNGGTAVINGTGCMTMQPYEPVVFTLNDVPLSAIYIIGTAGKSFSAWEGF